MSNPSYLFVNDAISPASNTPPLSTLLESHPGAYTTFRTHNNGLQLLFFERHLQRLANSARILFDACPKLLFKTENNLTPFILQQMKSLEWDSLVQTFVNGSLTKALPNALKEGKSEAELAFTALLSGDLEKLSPNERVDEDIIARVFNMHLHVSLYSPLVFGARGNGANLAVVGNGRDVATAKYSDWVRMRKPLEKLRPPSATELLLSSDGDRILEGCLTNFFVLCRKDNIEDENESTEKKLQKNKYGYPIELHTAPISDGVLPGVVRQVVIEVCLRMGIPVREVAPSWSRRHLWEEAFITNSLRLLQHVETIRVPSSWDSLDSKTWKEVTWEETRFEESPGSMTVIIQRAVMERAELEGYPITSFLN